MAETIYLPKFGARPPELARIAEQGQVDLVILEDYEEEAEALVQAVKAIHPNCQILVAETLQAFQQAVTKFKPHVTCTDGNFNDRINFGFNADKAIQFLKEKHPAIYGSSLVFAGRTRKEINELAPDLIDYPFISKNADEHPDTKPTDKAAEAIAMALLAKSFNGLLD